MQLDAPISTIGREHKQPGWYGAVDAFRQRKPLEDGIADVTALSASIATCGATE
jgi:hypothetical protein